MGFYFAEKIRRTITMAVPDNEGNLKQTSVTKAFDCVAVGKVTRLLNQDKSARFGEPFATMEVHYGPGQFARITGFSDNREKVASLKPGTLVTAIGPKMGGYGINCHELHIVDPQGNVKETVITNPYLTAPAAGEAEAPTA
jgi:hypothetical protein